MKYLIFKCLLLGFTLFCIGESSSIKAYPFSEGMAKELPTIWHTQTNLDYTTFNVDENLLKLLGIFGIYRDGSLKNIVEETQKKWLRKSGTERWHIEEQYADIKQAVFPILEELGFVNEVRPRERRYNYGVVLGALYSRIKTRLDYLVNLWNEGVRFDELIFLVGQRKLEPKEKELVPEGETETDVAKYIYLNSNLPEEMRKIKVVFVDAKPSGGRSRPDTSDSVGSWLRDYSPKIGKVLASSNQPYVLYQDAVLRLLLPSGFKVETVGERASDWVSVFHCI